MKKVVILLCLVIVLILPLTSLARVGVGVNVGKISVKKPLKPGGIYNLPYFGVLNNGDEPSDYSVDIAYLGTQSQKWPPKDWFTFNPSSFHLKPGQVQNIATKLVLPAKAKPGDYFAYLEAQPVAKSVKKGVTTIGVAAATKLYFTIAPANIFQAIVYRVSFFFKVYSPWTWIVLIVIIATIAIVLFRKYFSFQVGISKKQK